MDWTLLHPKLVHLPVALAVIMPLLTGGLLLAWWRGWLPKRAWLIGVLFQAALVGSGVAAMQTGEIDEDVVERVVADKYIDAHEDAAEVFVWAAAGVLLLSLGAAVVKPRPLSLGLAGATVAGALIVLGLGFQVGQAGGALVYEHGAPNAFIDGARARDTPPRLGDARRSAPGGAHEHDDD